MLTAKSRTFLLSKSSGRPTLKWYSGIKRHHSVRCRYSSYTAMIQPSGISSISYATDKQTEDPVKETLTLLLEIR